MWTYLGSLSSSTMLAYSMFMQLLPPPLRATVVSYTNTITSIVYPYITINFHEFTREESSLMRNRNEAYTAIQTYLSELSSQRATGLKAEAIKDNNTPLVLSMEDNEQIIDEFKGVKLWWDSNKTKTTPRTESFSADPFTDEKRSYNVTFHRSHRDLVIGSYLKHVLEKATAIEMNNRQLKLYTNNKTKWTHSIFQHTATFETLAMNPNKKEGIINDLVKFKTGKEFYAKTGRAWKRRYLLYGPPGTEKSTMIAAMANFMNYDVYDLELTAVKDNSDLRTLLINTSSKSIIVIEDIDCSLALTGQRNKNKKKKGKAESKETKYYVERGGGGDDDKGSKITLAGLLNVIDGICSVCGGEGIIVFTTNFVEKLDPALIRRGRMDMQIELSYCCYEAFKVLAKNHLDIESHNLFPTIENLLEEAKITTADVVGNLMPNEEIDICLQNLIQALEKSKKDTKKEGKKVRKREQEEEVAKMAERKSQSNPICKRLKVEKNIVKEQTSSSSQN